MTGKIRSAVLIWNPQSGRGGLHRADEVNRFCGDLKKRGIDVEAWRTTGSGDATRLAAQAAATKHPTVIVSGGDGTINEALQGLIGTGARLAIWPRGTSNVLARELRISSRPARAAELIERGVTRRIAVGCATDERSGDRRYFLLMAGVGLDASIVRSVPPGLKRLIGEAAFWYSGLGHLAYWQPASFNVEIDGQSFPATFAAIGKAPRYGGGLGVTPGARLDASEFEVCVVDSISRLRYLHLLTSTLLRGRLTSDAPTVRLIRTTHARVAGSSATLVQTDGELIGQLPMRFEILPDALEVIVP